MLDVFALTSAKCATDNNDCAFEVELGVIICNLSCYFTTVVLTCSMFECRSLFSEYMNL